MDLVMATEVSGLIIGVGGAGAVILKGGRALRRLGHFIDKLAGNGGNEPGILARLEALKETTDELSTAGVERDRKLDVLTQNQESLRTQAASDLTEVKTIIQEVKDKLDQHVDDVAPSLVADGQAWGQRLEEHLSDHDQRITALEGQPGGDPALGPHAP